MPKVLAFTYNEKLNQLKSDLDEKWLYGHDQVRITDFKKYLEQFSKEYKLKPEDQSQLEEYDDSPEDFKEALKTVAHQLNESGNTYIIFMDEVDLINVVPEKSTSHDEHLEVDLSFVSDFPNVHFVFCLRPKSDGQNNFKVQFPNQKTNQHFVWFNHMYRNCKPVIDLIQRVQENLGPDSDEGYPMIDPETVHENKLPPRLGTHGVVWIPTIPSEEIEALEQVHALISDLKEVHSTAILYTNKRTKLFAKKLKEENDSWRGPHQHMHYNGSEADIIVYVSDGAHLNIQSLARARRLLIILEYYGRGWNSTNSMFLKKATFKQRLVNMIRLKGCPYNMTECCGSDFDDLSIDKHRNEECLERHTTCTNIENGCEWNGKAKERQIHLEECQYKFEQCEGCRGHFIQKRIYECILSFLELVC